MPNDGTTLRHLLDSLAIVAPGWLLAQSHPVWRERYGPRFDDYRLPESKEAREALATVVGADGLALLTALYTPDSPG